MFLEVALYPSSVGLASVHAPGLASGTLPGETDLWDSVSSATLCPGSQELGVGSETLSITIMP